MDMPGRKTEPIDNYKYSFNGKLDDKSDGWQTQDYGFRAYDYRLGKFFSQDPLRRQYAYLTPYQFAGNTPIQGTDLDGRETFFIHGTSHNFEAWQKNLDIVGVVMKMSTSYKLDMNFSWDEPSGLDLNYQLNDYDDRETAALLLVNYVLTHMVKGEEINLCGYSHGGNVAIQAAHILFERFGIVSNLITINTPTFEKHTSLDGHPQYMEAPFIDPGINDHVHIWTTLDQVAGGASNGKDTYDNGYTTNIEQSDYLLKRTDALGPGIDAHYLENVNFNASKIAIQKLKSTKGYMPVITVKPRNTPAPGEQGSPGKSGESAPTYQTNIPNSGEDYQCDQSNEK